MTWKLRENKLVLEDPFVNYRTNNLRTADNIKQLRILLDYLDKHLHERDFIDIGIVTRSLRIRISTNAYFVKRSSSNVHIIQNTVTKMMERLSILLKQLVILYYTAGEEIVHCLIDDLQNGLEELEALLFQIYVM